MLEMKNPHPLSDTWNRSTNTEPMLVSNNKMKRKSRQPKRLFTAPEAERSSHPADMSDGESVDDVQTEACPVRGAAPLHTQQTGPGSGSADCDVSPSHSGAIDMRIGNNVPALPSTLCVLPGSPEVSPWPSVLSSRLRASLHSQLFSMEPAPSHSEYLEGHSPQDSPRKRTDPPGRVPEVRAIQQTRRLLANARERTRVHTISAAFEALRKQVPCYSYGQKLSKLAILRIACNYILSLAQLAELDYSPEHSSVSFSQCVEQCTRTLQAEGRSKKRKE